ncbi:MAG: HAMP domain-containing histidine kinase [Magnetococcales bacterium]|nr:HAMP domain-containing histidine kinase [Magnetococcales bacterium]
MEAMSDDELIAELKKRFDTTKKALHDVQMITKKLEEMNRRLQESEKIKSTFVSLVKNEINNPLTSILGLADQLRSGSATLDMVSPISAMIYKESFSLDYQLRNIFITAELESGEAEMQFSLVDIPAVLNDVRDSFEHLLPEKNLTCTVVAEEGLKFKTDREKLHLIASNLVANAIEYNTQDGSVEIKATVADGELSLAVADTGVGVDVTRTGRLFDRFSQGQSGVSKSFKGHGLGLTIIKALLETLEGSIKVEDNEGGGSIFSVTISEVEVDVEADAFSVDGGEFFFDDDDSSEAF